MGELQRQPKQKGPRSQREGKLIKGRLTVNPASLGDTCQLAGSCSKRLRSWAESDIYSCSWKSHGSGRWNLELGAIWASMTRGFKLQNKSTEKWNQYSLHSPLRELPVPKQSEPSGKWLLPTKEIENLSRPFNKFIVLGKKFGFQAPPSRGDTTISFGPLKVTRPKE